MDVQFEKTISLGAVLQIVVFVGTMLVAYTKFVARLTKLETKMNILWAVFSRNQGIKTRESEGRFFGDE